MTEKLSERVERLEGPDREIDRAIADAVGLGPPDDWLRKPQRGADGSWNMNAGDWISPCSTRLRKSLPYTASLDAAMSLVPEGFVLHNLQETPTIVHEEHTGWEPLPNWEATLLRQDCAGYRNRKKFMQAFEHGDGNTAAIALCAAALKARGL